MAPRCIALIAVHLLAACEPGASVPGVAELPVSAARTNTSASPSQSLTLTVSAATSEVSIAPSPIASNSSADPGPEAPKRRYTVAAIGDSLSDPKAHGGGYLTYLATHCKKSRFDTHGRGGNMVSQMKTRLVRDVFGEGEDDALRPTYSHLIVLGGIADVGSNETANRTVEKIQRDLLAMYRVAHDKGVTVVALTIPPWGAYYTYNDERHQMMLSMNTWLRAGPEHVSHVVDIFPKLVCEERELCTKYASDKIHWNRAAHDLVGELLLKQVFADCE